MARLPGSRAGEFASDAPYAITWTFSSVIQAQCARFIADRKIDVERLFTDRYTLDQAAEAYQLFDTQTTGKGVFLL